MRPETPNLDFLRDFLRNFDTDFAVIHPLDPDDVKKKKLEAACKKSHYETSTVADYLPFAKFYQDYPALHSHLPEFVKKVPLILECQVKCSCTDTTCKKSHGRVWKSNIEELETCGLLSSVSELRIVLYNDCPKDLHLDKAIQELGIPRGAIASTKLIRFLGRGLFYAGKRQESQDAEMEAIRTAQLILEHCPHARELWYHPDRYLVLDLKLVPEFVHLPPIPTDSMSHLELSRISNGINWGLFKTGPDRRVHFPNLQTLVMRFKEPEKGLLQSSLDVSRVVIPSTVGVTVTGIAHSRNAIWEYFKKGCRQLSLVESTLEFRDIDVYNLQCSKHFQLKLIPEEGDSSKPLPFVGLRNFFGHRNTVIRRMSVTGIEFMLPLTVKFHNMENLHLSLGIADSNIILNLAHSLTRLKILRIRCFSMYCNDLNHHGRGVYFANEDHELCIIAAHARDIPMIASKNLQCLHLYSHMAIDPNRFIKLMARFPNLAEIQVNAHKTLHPTSSSGFAEHG
ncbi:hypothetical protein DL89DRAFT_298357 [Linderina pennispora]|uniref:Uncharacterized protein n=1 Tax=Linderina pennispora TaxID=61395 RepID=A0A1Y1VQD9_9FUNG|nr:uncharacterized protein DL89DRAFT_298357 [Linderina pennispora]ORX63521.1 hypothetical protein DL89DRAFT_298357 [Linderina pennispora]